MSDEYYWGEITQVEMKRINEVSAQEGWGVAVNNVLAKNHPGLVGMVTGQDRVDWIHQLDANKKNVLDVGSGWGHNSYLLAGTYGHTVTSLELIPERAEFQRIRAKQEGIDDMEVVVGNILDKEFSENRFDLATFIGVLEWIGVDKRFKNPRDVQLDALRKVRTYLKSGGLVCIGIENRIGFNNFVGAKDHSGFSFTSLMPRSVANVYLRMRNANYRSNTSSDVYRTYTYTAAGYEKLLYDAGFKNVKILVSHPHYAHPRNLIPYDNTSIRRHFWEQYKANTPKDFVFCSFFKILSIVGLGHVFAPHFVIFAEK